MNYSALAIVWTSMIGLEAAVTEPTERGGAEEERAAAFARLADRQLGASYRLAGVLLGSDADAQDAVQDAALIAWHRFGSLRDPERFPAWFQRILVNGCRDRLRQRSRVRILPMDAAMEVGRPFPSARLAERDALAQVLAELGPDQRTVIVLHYFAGLTLEAVAEQTGERLGTVKSRLHAALGALHAAYDAADRDGEGNL